MEKISLLMFLIMIISSCDQVKRVDEKVDVNPKLNLSKYENDTISHYYREKIKIHDEINLVKVDFINPNKISIFFKKDSYVASSKSLKIVLNNKLEIINYSYNSSAFDTSGGHQEIHELSSIYLVLNQNPFDERGRNLKGYFVVKGIITIRPKPEILFLFSKKENFVSYGVF